ncbi:ATP-binding cassette domain-containing protein, partial [Falsiroseomonas sp.]|uniref:ATP-binding cassette domain-containing protein n=1 Tax=Falsiroseomonas sp. TaxID=2870721 RepID=UPI00271BB1DF
MSQSQTQLQEQVPDAPRTFADSEVPMVELRQVARRFSKKLDIAARLARRLGAAVKEEIVHAVDHVDLRVRKGEVVGLVGESGCGKSTLGRIVAGILPQSEGQVFWNGQDVAGMQGEAAKIGKLRRQMIFQDPYASLNPRMRVADIVGEAPLVHGLTTRGNFDAYVDEQMRRAGLDPAFKRRYPHQFSGGQRQRIGIARALAVA